MFSFFDFHFPQSAIEQTTEKSQSQFSIPSVDALFFKLESHLFYLLWIERMFNAWVPVTQPIWFVFKFKIVYIAYFIAFILHLFRRHPIQSNPMIVFQFIRMQFMIQNFVSFLLNFQTGFCFHLPLRSVSLFLFTDFESRWLVWIENFRIGFVCKTHKQITTTNFLQPFFQLQPWCREICFI